MPTELRTVARTCGKMHCLVPAAIVWIRCQAFSSRSRLHEFVLSKTNKTNHEKRGKLNLSFVFGQPLLDCDCSIAKCNAFDYLLARARVTQLS